MTRTHHAGGRFVAGFFAGIAAAVVTGLVWPATSYAAPTSTGAFGKVGGPASEVARTEAKAADEAAARAVTYEGSQAKDRDRADVFSLFFPFLDREWPPLVELGLDAERMTSTLERAMWGFGMDAEEPAALAAQIERDAAWPRVDLQNEPDAYVLHVQAPGADVGDVKVDVQGQRVTVSYSSKSDQAQPATSRGPKVATHRSEAFEESLTVGGPVKSSEMQVERHGDRLDVTLPKAPSHS